MHRVLRPVIQGGQRSFTALRRGLYAETQLQRGLHAEAQLQRGLVHVRGKEASPFLQGLVTNDMTHLEDGARSMYAMLLNTQGRMVFDALIYKESDEGFILDCDVEKVDQLVRHLKVYKVRRKLDIKVVEDHVVWAVFDPDLDAKDITHVDVESLYLNPKAESEVLLQTKDTSGEFIVTRDPRMKYLGHRLILPKDKPVEDVVSDVQCVQDSYRSFRYGLGVGEGVQELPPTKCLPLEANLDYLHGVSFHKGCYIGQELTARTYHTGVIRKRYMPLRFPSDTGNLPIDTTITNEKGKNVGKVRGVNGGCGIGLLRVKECLDAECLTAEGVIVSTFKPPWWPIQASKDRRG